MSILVFRSCSTTGFTETNDYVASTNGGNEVADNDVYDFLSGLCATYKLTYLFAYQGSHRILPAFMIHQGVISQLDHSDKSYRYDSTSLMIYSPGTGQAVLVRNGTYGLDTVECVGSAVAAPAQAELAG